MDQREALRSQVLREEEALLQHRSKAVRKSENRRKALTQLENLDPEQHYPSGRKRHVRRCANEIQKSLACPYAGCEKTYGCEGSLNLHIKVKHSGGTKTERDKFARMLMIAQETGGEKPKTRLNLYEGFEEYAEKNFSSKALAQKEEEEKARNNIVKIVMSDKELRLQSQPVMP